MGAETAIRELIDTWCAATNQAGEAGADGYVSCVVEDVINLPPNGERIDGREALRTWTLDFTAADEWSIHWEARDVVVSGSGDLAFAIGAYRFSMRDPEGNKVEDKGKFLDTLALQADGSWKVTAIAYNSDLPAA